MSDQHKHRIRDLFILRAKAIAGNKGTVGIDKMIDDALAEPRNMPEVYRIMTERFKDDPTDPH